MMNLNSGSLTPMVPTSVALKTRKNWLNKLGDKEYNKWINGLISGYEDHYSRNPDWDLGKDILYPALGYSQDELIQQFCLCIIGEWIVRARED